MNILDVTNYKQLNCQCAVASVASVVNYFDSDVDYEVVRDIAFGVNSKFSSNGLHTAQIGLLLNLCGFKKVSIYSNDDITFDYDWSNISKARLINQLVNKTKANNIDETIKHQMKIYIDFLHKQKLNKIVFDYDFKKIITKSIQNQLPVLLCFNWNKLFHKSRKDPYFGNKQGQAQYHQVVIVGCNDQLVCIQDPNDNLFKCPKKRIEYVDKGRYFMKWDILASVISRGQIHVAEKYCSQI